MKVHWHHLTWLLLLGAFAPGVLAQANVLPKPPLLKGQASSPVAPTHNGAQARSMPATPTPSPRVLPPVVRTLPMNLSIAPARALPAKVRTDNMALVVKPARVLPSPVQPARMVLSVQPARVLPPSVRTSTMNFVVPGANTPTLASGAKAPGLVPPPLVRTAASAQMPPQPVPLPMPKAPPGSSR